ncbi:zf-CCHC domain-containing protein, partial [Tanacetum coccineum]
LIEKETSGQSCLNYANTSKVNDGHGDNNDSIVTNAKRSDANIVVPKSVLAAKIHDMERQMLDGKLVLVDNEGVPLKPIPKVTVIQEYKDLSTLPLDELIGNLKVYEVALEKDSKVSKNKKKKYKSLAHKAKKQSSDEEASCSDSDDEEYAMANSRKAKEQKKRKEERRCFNCGDSNHFISDCPKHSFNDQKAFVGGCWSDSDEEDNSTKDEICLMTLDNNEIEYLLKNVHSFENNSHFLQEMIENQRSQKDKKGLGFTEDGTLTSEVKIGKVGHESGKTPTVEPAEPVPSAREPASSNEGNRPL